MKYLIRLIYYLVITFVMNRLSSIIENLIKGKENMFWKGGFLLEEQTLRLKITQLLDELDLKEGQFRVHGTYLFGSVLNLQDKKRHRRDPQDIDLYFWINNIYDEDKNFKLKHKAEQTCSVYGLTPHIVIGSCHPFDYDYIPITKAHTIYQHKGTLEEMKRTMLSG